MGVVSERIQVRGMEARVKKGIGVLQTRRLMGMVNERIPGERDGRLEYGRGEEGKKDTVDGCGQRKDPGERDGRLEYERGSVC